MQEDLVHLSTKGKQNIAKNSSHYIQIDRPELVIEEVRKLVNGAREAVVVDSTRPLVNSRTN
jgi:hypothetical protein